MRMLRKRGLCAPVLFAVLAACTAAGEAQRPVVVTAALGKVVEGISAEAVQRQAGDTFRGLPLVVRSGAGGAETVIAEMLRTRLTERGAQLEVACPAKCLEITLVEFVMEATGQAAPGQLLPVNAGTIAGLSGLPRAPSEREKLAAGHASALLVTFAARDGNRYNGRQQIVAVVALAKAADSGR
jgi:hypothetical protein